MKYRGTPNTRTGTRIIGAISFFLLCLTVLVGGRQAAFVFRASKATATFDGAIARTGGNHGGTFLYPQFKFVTKDGQAVEMTSKIGSTDQPYDDGQKDSVLYDPQHPSQAVLDHFWILWAPTVVLGLITFIPAFLFAADWFSASRSLRTPDRSQTW